MPLTSRVKDSLTGLFAELEALASVLIQSCRGGDWERVAELVPQMKSYVRSIKDDVPAGEAKSQLTRLDSHVHFVSVYATKRDPKFVLSNAHSMAPDIQRLRSVLGIGVAGEVWSAIEDLPEGPEKRLLAEAARCYEADAHRAASVMAVCSLESLLRSFYSSKTGKDSRKLTFWELIDRVGKLRGLTDAQKGLLNLCRPFRNFAAHPSEYEYSRGESLGLIHLAAEQVRK